MQWFRSWWARMRGRPAPAAGPLTDRQQAQALIAAIDRGGVPLNPARVNQIARSLGLEVSARAPMEHTVERIRQALARAG
jgi:hypothetical protein